MDRIEPFNAPDTFDASCAGANTSIPYEPNLIAHAYEDFDPQDGTVMDASTASFPLLSFDQGGLANEDNFNLGHYTSGEGDAGVAYPLQPLSLNNFGLSQDDAHETASDVAAAVASTDSLTSLAMFSSWSSAASDVASIATASASSSKAGLTWTVSMDSFLMQAKREGKRHAAIAEEMQRRFGVAPSYNMLSKRYKVIKGRDSDVKKAFRRAMPQVKQAVQEQVEKLDARDFDREEVISQLHHRVPEMLNQLAEGIEVNLYAPRD